LCRDEYNKVSGLDNAKQIWDTLKISHEGNDATMITKMELVEGKLGRFAMIRGEDPTQTYNRLKTLVNKIRSYGSTRWTDHDVVRLMLRSFTVIDPHLVNLIRENPRYTKMTPEEILEKFVSGRMMVKEARYFDDALNGPIPIYEPQPVALKATSSSREALPSKVVQVEAAGLNEDEMALIIKRFKTALKGRKEHPNKSKAKGKCSCFKCGKTGHFIANCPDNANDLSHPALRNKARCISYMRQEDNIYNNRGSVLATTKRKGRSAEGGVYAAGRCVRGDIPGSLARIPARPPGAAVSPLGKKIMRVWVELSSGPARSE
jgi:hypothetical protein